MYKYIKAAESDYIKIGNMVIPKNAASYGYDSYENITRDAKRRYNAEKDAVKNGKMISLHLQRLQKLRSLNKPDSRYMKNVKLL